jgi:hypothetical protein
LFPPATQVYNNLNNPQSFPPAHFSIHDSQNLAINQQYLASAVGQMLVSKSSVTFTQHVQYLARAASISAPSYCGKTPQKYKLIFMELAINLVVYVKSILRAHLFLPFSNYNQETHTGGVA